VSTEIKSGASADHWTIDPISKAGRVTLYDTLGVEVNKAPLGSYMLPINMGRLTAAIAANSLIWSMRNAVGSGKTVKIRRVLSNVAFDGTAAATTALYDWVRYSAATPTGGTPMVVIKKRNTAPPSAITDARFNAGAALSVTSVVFETSAFSIGNQRQVAAGKTADLRFEVSGQDYDNFELAAGEGFGVRLNVASVIGDSISGGVTWDET
jgi:hypothetical protein